MVIDLKILTDKQLDGLLKAIVSEQQTRCHKKHVAKVKKLTKGKHIRVVAWDEYSQAPATEFPNRYRYSFYYVNGDDELDFYYDVGEKMKELMYDCIPPVFSEECENSYSYYGTFDKAKEVLAMIGITDVVKREATW